MENNERKETAVTHTNEDGTINRTTIQAIAFEEDKITIAEFLANPDNKKAAAAIAFQIQKAFPGWFKMPRLVKLFDTSTDQAAKQIEMLMLFNLCIGKVEKKVPSFKIDLDRKVQRTLLLEQIAEKEGEILFLKKKLSDLD